MSELCSEAQLYSVGRVDVPIMPHRTYDRERLDELYPTLEACELEEVEEADDDAILNHGRDIADAMVRQTEDEGRRRVVVSERQPNDHFRRPGGVASN